MAILVIAQAGFVAVFCWRKNCRAHVADRLLGVGTEMSKQGSNMYHEDLNQSVLQVMCTEISLHSSIEFPNSEDFVCTCLGVGNFVGKWMFF